MPHTYHVRVYKTETREWSSRTTYRTRWKVASKTWAESFRTLALAESFRSELIAAARSGEAFDTDIGLPVSMGRLARRLPWLQLASEYVAMKWPHLAPNSRRNTAKALTVATLALLTTERRRPPLGELRRALTGWSFNMRAPLPSTPPAEIQEALRWLANSTRDVADLAEPSVTRTVLNAFATKIDGTPAAPAWVQRQWGVLVNVAEYAVERGFLTRNPVTALTWKAPRTVKSVDKRVVVNPGQARALLLAVEQQRPSGPMLKAFFAVMYYSALRTGEAANLRRHNLYLPEQGWGELLIEESAPASGSMWTDSGNRREVRQLKHRAMGETRSVPCPPELTAILHDHLVRLGTDEHGRLFRGVRGGGVSEGTYCRVWRKARAAALTAGEAASPLASRPYHLRHAAVSTWLNAGVPSTQVAEWAGHGVGVLHQIYAKCIAGQEEAALRRIAAALDQ